MTDPRYVSHPDTASASVADGMVVLHMGTKSYYSLNETGAEIWRLLESRMSEHDAVQRLVRVYDVREDEARHSVARLIADLVAENLVAEAEP